MSHRARRITDSIQEFDRELYAKDDGKAIRIFRKCKEQVLEYMEGGIPLLNTIRNDHLVMSLTDTWGVNGKPVDWGVEPILARLRALDLWRSGNAADQFFANEEKMEASKEREFRNTTESFLYDFKSQFAKSTNDINTSNMNKTKFRNIGV